MEAYFKTIHQSGIYSDELNQIKSDHYYSKMNFIHNHEEYIAQEEVIRQAQKQMREIEESLVADFQNNNPIPKPKNEKVTWDDVRKIEQSFIN
jgi:2-oxo-4-hydroxy-4-carboxy--5-ureidoimidazoline (OHCU) decarboxylase